MINLGLITRLKQGTNLFPSYSEITFDGPKNIDFDYILINLSDKDTHTVQIKQNIGGIFVTNKMTSNKQYIAISMYGFRGKSISSIVIANYGKELLNISLTQLDHAELQRTANIKYSVDWQSLEKQQQPNFTKSVADSDQHTYIIQTISNIYQLIQNDVYATKQYVDRQIQYKVGELGGGDTQSNLANKSEPTIFENTITFNTNGQAFILGDSQKGTLINGLNVGLLDGFDQQAFQLVDHQHQYVRNDVQQQLKNITFQNISISPAHNQVVGGLNADTVDGKHAADLQQQSHAHDNLFNPQEQQTITGQITFDKQIQISGNQTNQLITGMNQEKLDGKTQSEIIAELITMLQGQTLTNILTTNMQQTITGQITFNPAGQPFVLQESQKGQLINGLNQQLLGGNYDTQFQLQSHTHDYLSQQSAQDVNQLFTFDKSGQPFAVTSSQRVDGLNADMLDGKHQSEFADATHEHSEFCTPAEASAIIGTINISPVYYDGFFQLIS